jgi:NADPH:quinone reductase
VNIDTSPTAPTTTTAVVNADSGRLDVRLDHVALAPARPHEAVVAVDAFSINRGELALLGARPAGWRPGQDVAGRVLVPAADGSGPVAGSRVVGLVEGAGWARHVTVPTDRLAVLPDAVDSAAAATLGIAGLTALRIVRLGGSLLGVSVLITGASGSVGRYAVQLAALQGAHVTAVARRGGDELVTLGAAAVIAEPGGGPFSFVLEGIGGGSLAAAITATAPGATIVIYGTASGEPTPLTIYDFLGGHEDVKLRTYFSYAQPEAPAADLALLVGLLAEGTLQAPIAQTASWEKIDDALAAMDAGASGKHVLTIT